MLKVSILELFLRFIPEAALIILTGYIISRKKIELSYVFISSIILAVSIYLIRMLPIQFGIHTILGGIISVLLLISINKISIDKSVFSIFIVIILEGIFETLNLIFIRNILALNTDAILSDPISKVIWFIPSLILVSLTIFIIMVFINKHYKSKNF